MNLEHSSQYNKTCSERQTLFQHLFVLSAVILSGPLHDAGTSHFLYPGVASTQHKRHLHTGSLSLTDVRFGTPVSDAVRRLDRCDNSSPACFICVIVHGVHRLFKNGTESPGPAAGTCWLCGTEVDGNLA